RSMSTKFPQKSRCVAMGRRIHWRSLLKEHPSQAVNKFCFFEGDLGSAVILDGT
ncbi:18113_t:CDS:1, partial [Funneliformis geosporum]